MSMITVKPYPHVVMGANKTFVVVRSDVPVARLFRMHREGVLVDTLMRRYPQFHPAEVLSALAFAYDNTELLDAMAEAATAERGAS